jgi:hypothetical protein
VIGVIDVKKDFNAALKQNNAFDGFAISQTEEERAAQKGADVPAAPQTAPAQKTTTDIATETEKSKKMRRISIYMDDDKLFNNLDMYCQVHGISKNKLVIKLLQEYLTEERMQKVRNSLAALD